MGSGGKPPRTHAGNNSGLGREELKMTGETPEEKLEREEGRQDKINVGRQPPPTYGTKPNWESKCSGSEPRRPQSSTIRKDPKGVCKIQEMVDGGDIRTQENPRECKTTPTRNTRRGLTQIGLQQRSQGHLIKRM